MSFLNRLPVEQYVADAFDAFAPGGFSIGSARAMAWLAQLAYEDEAEKVAAILHGWGLRRLASFDCPTTTPLLLARTRGFLAAGRGAAFLVFQGTDPLVAANWVTNFNFRLNQDGVHQGFTAALAAAWPQLGEALRAADPGLPLIVGGHSLGGALAALAALRMVQEFAVAADAVYTFGMPRVGSPAFARGFDQKLGERTYRLVHGEDLVPTVPPSNFNFRHVGRMLACARHAKFDAALLSPGGGDDPPFVASLVSRTKAGLRQYLAGSLGPPTRPDLVGRASRLLPPGAADHLPDRYWRALEP